MIGGNSSHNHSTGDCILTNDQIPSHSHQFPSQILSKMPNFFIPDPDKTCFELYNNANVLVYFAFVFVCNFSYILSYIEFY